MFLLKLTLSTHFIKWVTEVFAFFKNVHIYLIFVYLVFIKTQHVLKLGWGVRWSSITLWLAWASWLGLWLYPNNCTVLFTSTRYHNIWGAAACLLNWIKWISLYSSCASISLSQFTAVASLYHFWPNHPVIKFQPLSNLPQTLHLFNCPACKHWEHNVSKVFSSICWN